MKSSRILRILLIQGTLHAMVIVMQLILFLGIVNITITYGLFIPLLLHGLIMFGSLNSLSWSYNKELVSLIAPKEKQK